MSTQYNYRLVVKTPEATTKMAGATCHETKSLAGRLFRNEKVQSVYVGDVTGKPFLYLVKGKPEKTLNIPSENAHFG